MAYVSIVNVFPGGVATSSSYWLNVAWHTSIPTTDAPTTAEHTCSWAGRILSCMPCARMFTKHDVMVSIIRNIRTKCPPKSRWRLTTLSTGKRIACKMSPLHFVSTCSRQRYVLGDSAMQRMAASKVYLHGLGGLGVEIGEFDTYH